MAQSTTCDNFRVGTKAWTDCVHDSATGGGLMPWIVVVPLAVMVVGMFIGFARQYSAAGRRRAASHGTSGTAGTWLIFVAFVELAIGVGNVVAVRRGGGAGYGMSAVILLGVGVLLFVIGVGLKVKGRGRARIYNTGLPGEATVRAVHETGVMVNNKPMYQFEVDVEGSGFAPTKTSMREVVPFWMAGRIGPDSKMPVKVDPSNPSRVIVDWERFGGGSQVPTDAAGFRAAGGGAQPGAPEAGTSQIPMPSVSDMARAMNVAREGGAGSGWHLGKVFGGIALLLVLAVVGAGVYFVSTIFQSVTDATNEVTDQVNDAIDQVGGIRPGGNGSATTLEVSRSAEGRGPVAYSVALPVGWLDLTASEEERQPPLVVDLVMKPQTPSEARIVVTRSLRFLEDPAPPAAQIRSVRRELLAEYGDSLAGTRGLGLDGEPALEINVVPGSDGLRSRQVAVMRGGQVLFVSLTADRGEWDELVPVFEAVLASWKWTSP